MSKDWAWIEAAKEVDALAPAAPPIFVEVTEVLTERHAFILPRGWRYNQFVDAYFGPNGKRFEGLTVRNMDDPQGFWIKQAADLSDVLTMAACGNRGAPRRTG